MEHLKRILLAQASGPAEMIMAITMLAYGLPMLLPPEEFPTYQAYAQMSRLASETIWGATLVGISSCRIYVISRENLPTRKMFTLASIAVWTFLCVLFLLAQPSSPGVWMFGTWSLLESWTLFRIRRTN